MEDEELEFRGIEDDEEDEGEMLVYAVVSDPLESNGFWLLDTLYFMSESETMGSGTITCRNKSMADKIVSYFKNNVYPLDNAALEVIYEESKKERMH